MRGKGPYSTSLLHLFTYPRPSLSCSSVDTINIASPYYTTAQDIHIYTHCSLLSPPHYLSTILSIYLSFSSRSCLDLSVDAITADIAAYRNIFFSKASTPAMVVPRGGDGVHALTSIAEANHAVLHSSTIYPYFHLSSTYSYRSRHDHYTDMIYNLSELTLTYNVTITYHQGCKLDPSKCPDADWSPNTCSQRLYHIKVVVGSDRSLIGAYMMKSSH